MLQTPNVSRIEPNVLAFETSGSHCSVALSTNQKVFFSRNTRFHHEENVLSMIHNVLSFSKLHPMDLQAIAFGHGPGRFTGVRLAVNLAQGLSLGWNVPIVSVSTLEILAQEAWRKTRIRNVVSIVGAKPNDVFWSKRCRVRRGCWTKEDDSSLQPIDRLQKVLSKLRGAWVVIGIPQIVSNFGATTHQTVLSVSPLAIDVLPSVLYCWKSGQCFAFNDVDPQHG